MYAVFNFITIIFDALLYPFRNLAPVWGVTFMALLTAVFVLYIYKRVSNQRAIKRIKERIQGHFLGIYLFRDDISQVLASQGRVFSNVLRYMGHSLLPLAVMIVPIFLVCVQMQLRYGYANLRPGETVPVSIDLAPGVKVRAAAVKLATSGGLTVETPPLRIERLNEIDWRLRVNRYGEEEVRFTVDGAEIRQTVSVGKTVRRIYPVRERSPLLGALLYPGETPIAGEAPVKRVTVGYNHATVNLFGLQLHWSIVYFLLAIVFGIILKPIMKVDF